MSFYKFVVIGDPGAGKTSMLNRIVYNIFKEKYNATIGCEFGLKILELNGEFIRIQFWDLSGQDRLAGISRLYCRDIHGAIVVSDATRENGLEQACDWKNKLYEVVYSPDDTPIPSLLCVSKKDALTRESYNKGVYS